MTLARLLLILVLLIPTALAEQCLNGQCYECDGTLVERDNKVICLKCNEGFELVGNSCEAIPSQYNYKPTVFDNFLYSYFPNNPLFGFLIVVGGIIFIAYIFFNRKNLKRRFK